MAALSRVDIETVKLAREMIEKQLERETEVFELGFWWGLLKGRSEGVEMMHDQINGASLLHGFKLGPLERLDAAVRARRQNGVGDMALAFYARHGGEYRGGAVDWTTGRPL